MPGNTDICNFEVRNYRYKGHSAGGNKVDACWVVSFNREPWNIEFVYLFESAIDAMSFYELNSFNPVKQIAARGVRIYRRQRVASPNQCDTQLL